MMDWTSESLEVDSPPFSINGTGQGKRVIIIGAGASGLAAGATLRKIMPSASVKIIEARNRIGGRIRTASLPMETNNIYEDKTDNMVDNSLHEQFKQECSVDLGAAYVHGCNVTNPLYRQAVCNNRKLDTSAGGYSIGWGEKCLWRSKDGRVIDKKSIKGAFKLAWSLKREVESSMLETKKLRFGVAGDLQKEHHNLPHSQLKDPEKQSCPTSLRLSLLEKDDVCLREAVDEILNTKFNKQYMQLSEDQKSVLKSTEVLLWSYVAPMHDLSTRMLNEISIPAPSTEREANNSKDEHVKNISHDTNQVDEPLYEIDDAVDQSEVSQSEFVQSPQEMFEGRASRRRRQPEAFEPEDFIETKKRRSPKSVKHNADSELIDERKLTWLDGLVSGGYFGLVCAPLSQGLNIELGRIVKEVNWEGRVCRVVSWKNKEALESQNLSSGLPGTSSSTTSPTSSERSEDMGLSSDNVQIDECDFVIIALPLGVLKGLHEASSLTFHPPLPQRKIEAIEKIGFGSENKIILRFSELFWEENEPYLQTVDERFRILNGHYFGKGNTLVFHTSPPFGKGYDGLSDDQVVNECMKVLREMYGVNHDNCQDEKRHFSHSYDNINSAHEASEYSLKRPGIDIAFPVWSYVTRWDIDPFAMGAYSYWASGMQLSHIEDIATPEPAMIEVEVSKHNHPDDIPLKKECGSVSSFIEPKLYFCGEHVTIRDAQCVHGACNSGERAARQVACAALGFLEDLHECICKGESFWYQVQSMVPSAQDSDASKLSGGNDLSGKSILLHPLYSPFPTQEAVRWYQDGWNFDCACGTRSRNFDDGTSMLQCEVCKTWQHLACAKSYMKTLGKREEYVANGYHCFQCYVEDISSVVKDEVDENMMDKSVSRSDQVYAEFDLEKFDSDSESGEDFESSELVNPQWKILMTELSHIKSKLSMTAQTAMANEWLRSSMKANEYEQNKASVYK